MKSYFVRGFTLVEMLVVVSVVGILASIIYANFGEARSSVRDDIRKSSIKELELAVRLYKAQNGTYPLGCRGSGQWSGGTGGTYTCSPATDPYIVGLAPEFLASLPVDPKANSGTNNGILYWSDGVDYKILVNLSVEEKLVSSYADEFARCPAQCSGSPCGCTGATPPSTTYAVYSDGAKNR